jgi:NitT/TauT family transport system ATP-binding protein
MASLIAFRNLGFRYETLDGEGMEALRGIDLDVPRDQFLAVVGPSGCGKSTLLRLIAGLLRPSSGQALLEGRAATEPRTDIGFVFQSPNLLPWLNVLDNVLFPLKIMRRLTPAGIATAKDLLALAGIADVARRMPQELSGGMQQRAAICRALVHDPAVLLMDEPFGALDALTREEMSLELLRIWTERPKTVVLVTHSIAEAVMLADRVIVMGPRPGRILSDIPIAIPRPRDAECQYSQAFQRAAQRIRADIFGMKEAPRAAAE